MTARVTPARSGSASVGVWSVAPSRNQTFVVGAALRGLRLRRDVLGVARRLRAGERARRPADDGDAEPALAQLVVARRHGRDEREPERDADAFAAGRPEEAKRRVG